MTEDGLALDNDQGTGLRGLIKKIRNDADWVEFVRLCTERSGRIQKNELIQQENVVKCLFFFLIFERILLLKRLISVAFQC